MTQPYYQTGSRITATLYQADARTLPVPDQSIHCVVTSPPYFGLRVYQGNDERGIGVEQTPEQYLDSIMAVFDEVWRVLRDDGICWVNLGDSQPSGQLLQIPARFALRMQDAGWILRDKVVWAKSTSMPESLGSTRWQHCRVKVGQHNGRLTPAYKAIHGDSHSTTLGPEWRKGEPHGNIWADCPGCAKCADNDGYVLRRGSWRCTSSYEEIFMFVKQMGYFSDGEAVKTMGNLEPHKPKWKHTVAERNDRSAANEANHREWGSQGGANRRNVWKDIKSEHYGGAHYATFPSDLPRICIQASTSEAGVCAECGAQCARVVEHTVSTPHQAEGYTNASGRMDGGGERPGSYMDAETRTLGWRATCSCNAAKVPATVLDPFCGTGTTLLAANRLGHSGIGVDLSLDYLEQARKRLAQGVLL